MARFIFNELDISNVKSGWEGIVLLTYQSVKLFMPNEYDTLISLSGLK